MTKIYIDSRFRTANSKSESDFNVELPRSFNVPDGVVAHIDDIVIPVSWTTIDERNRNGYVRMYSGSTVVDSTFTLVVQNYNGAQFATELSSKLNYAILLVSPLIEFTVIYDHAENMMGIGLVDARTAALQLSNPFNLEFLTDEKIITDPALRIADPRSINCIIRNTKQTFINDATPYTCYLDLFNTRNLYLTSSALCSYDTVSNFGVDTIIKKIPCTASYNHMIFQSSGSTLDGLDVSKRTLRFLDFKLVDSSFRAIPLQGNHFSFSIVFQQKH